MTPFAALLAVGFSRGQARALADAGYGVVSWWPVVAVVLDGEE